jgi:hypothetical protein
MAASLRPSPAPSADVSPPDHADAPATRKDTPDVTTGLSIASS